MKSLINFVDKVYCIHDVNSNERKEIYDNLKTLSPEYVFADRPFKGFQTNSFQYAGVFGNTLSHLRVIILASHQNYNKAIAVFEDDVSIRTKIDADSILANAISNLPDDWGILYLNGNPLGKTKQVKGNLYTCDNIVCTFSYILNVRYLKELSLYYINSLGKESPNCICDAIIRDFFLHKNIPLYCVYPFVINHNDGIAIARNNEKRNYDESFFETQWKKSLER